MLFKNIYTFACSHGLIFESYGKDGPPPRITTEGSWSNMLQTKHNLCDKVYNYSDAGCSNLQIYTRLMRALYNNEPKEGDLIILQWSYLTRNQYFDEAYAKNKHQHPWDFSYMDGGGVHYTPPYRSKEHEDMSNAYFKHFYKDIISYSHMLANTVLIRDWTRRHNVKLMVTGVEEQSLYQKLEDEYYKFDDGLKFTGLDVYYSFDHETPYQYMYKNYPYNQISYQNHLNEFGSEIVSDKLAEIIRNRF